MQGRFLQNITFEYYKRQNEEERPDCRTPPEWRLTPEIRREFVLTMRTVALLSMFSRDALTIANSQSALKTMGFLEPDLIFPPVLERAYPALEGLLEVSRLPCLPQRSEVQLKMCTPYRRIGLLPSLPPCRQFLPLSSEGVTIPSVRSISSPFSNSVSPVWTSTIPSRQ